MNLHQILTDHEAWLADPSTGKRADLYNADLHGANLHCANLRGASLRDADLQCADLRGADLEGADLRGADLCRADLRGADLQYADLRGADIRGADLRCTDLSGACLRDTNAQVYKGSRHTVYSTGDGYIHVGCVHHTIDYWLANYASIGKANSYTSNQILEYASIFTHIELVYRTMVDTQTLLDTNSP